MSRFDKLALFLSLLTVLVTGLVADRVFDRVPHLEDEFAYVWQANMLTQGRLTLPSPAHAKSFLVPFVVDYEGQRFGKYPLGWPVVLASGIKLGLRAWINPLLAGLAVWLTYFLGKHLFNEFTGLLAAGLTLSSPFFLMHSGLLLSHPLGLVLSLAFTLAWLHAFGGIVSARPGVFAALAGISLGALALTRPFTAVAISIPFALHGLYLLFKGDNATRRRLVLMGLLATAVASLHFAWQYAAAGNPLLNLYTLWWPYDKVGFGPGFGVTDTGHTLHLAYINTKHSLKTGAYDLFGWGSLSWIFLPFGLWAGRRKHSAWLVASLFPVLVFVYLAYWIGSFTLGPRYFYESLFSLTLFSAAGIVWLAGWAKARAADSPPPSRWTKVRPLLVTGLLTLLVGFNLLVYTPLRVGGMKDLYGIGSKNLEPFQTAEMQEMTPALFIVHTHRWMSYGALLELEDPALTSPIVLAWSRGPNTDAQLPALFPGYAVFHYYPDEPYKFYTAPRPDTYE